MSARRVVFALLALSLVGALGLARAQLGWFRVGDEERVVRLPYVMEVWPLPPVARVRVSHASLVPDEPRDYTVGSVVREAWFLSTQVDLGPEGSLLVRHTGGLGT